MKKFKIRTLASISVYVILAFVFTSCGPEPSGVTSKTLMDEQYLPDELKGLKIYSVSTGYGNEVKVAVLEDKLNSITYNVGKIKKTTVLINKQNGNQIEVSEILVENDSVIVCRK